MFIYEILQWLWFFQSCRALGQASFNLNWIAYYKSEVLNIPDGMDLKIWSSPHCKKW